MKGRIKNHEVVSLIDSRSTHNFLDATELFTLNLPLDTSQILEVKVADGNIIKTLGVCHGVTVIIQRYKFVVDFNVLQMGGGNVRHLYCISVFGYKSVCVSAGVCMY